MIDSELRMAFCDEAQDLLLRWESLCLELAKVPQPEHFQELFRIAHNLKGGSRAVAFIDFGDLVHRIEDGITLLREEQIKFSPVILQFLFETQKVLIEWMEQLRSQPDYRPQLDDYIDKLSSVFLNTDNNADITSENNIESVPDKQEEPQLASEVKSPSVEATVSSPPPTSSVSAPSTSANSSVTKASSETIRIPAFKLDQLIQTIGELSIHQSIVWHTKGDALKSNKMFVNSARLSQKLTNELYDRALSLRMQPLQSVFQRLERNILDLSIALKKKVDVQILGGEVELDKTVIERILDPLTHLVRNAIDHGIESAQERLSSGKNEAGRIEITARQDAFGVEIRIQDDGKGIRSDKIRAKAIEKKLIDANAELSPKEIFKLIFLPGFSTAEKVTNVSGRGVGMDVVKRTLDELHGQIDIHSEPGQGSSFIISLPTSVSIIEAMVVSNGEQAYVIPVGAVEEVLSVADHHIEEGQEMLYHHNQVLPLIDLQDAIRQRYNRPKQVDKKKSVLVCRLGMDRIGLMVEDITDQQHVVIRPLNENISGVFGLIGGTILGNGDPGLIVDIPMILQKYVQTVRPKEMTA